MADSAELHVRVVLALPDEARELALTLAPGTTARAAVREAVSRGLRIDDIDFDVTVGPIGIHGRQVGDAEAVLDGDRVEIYRPLLQDPMERRRREAAQGRQRRATS